MPLLAMRINATGLARVNQIFDTVKRTIETDKDKIATAGLHGAAEVFDRNFVMEGGLNGGWKALADSTVRERERMGVGGEHPILIRYEDLRDYTATLLQGAGASATFAVTDPDGGSLRVQLSTKNGTAIVTASGTKSVQQTGTRDGHVPARPYWFANALSATATKKGAVEQIVKGLRRM